MQRKTGIEVRDEYIKYMGNDLGICFSVLVGEVQALGNMVRAYKVLFATKKSRVELMNKASGHFFLLVQEALFDLIVLKVSELAARKSSNGRANQENATLWRAHYLLNDGQLKKECSRELGSVSDIIKAAKRHRDKRIAHTAIEFVSGKVVLGDIRTDGLEAILKCYEEFVCKIHSHHMPSDLGFCKSDDNGAMQILSVIHGGVKYNEGLEEGIKSGRFGAEEVAEKYNL